VPYGYVFSAVTRPLPVAAPARDLH
jgi:hypothetical protein